jgi:hypothetical protein
VDKIVWGTALERISLLGCVFSERLGKAHNLKSPYIAMFFHIPGISNAVAAQNHRLPYIHERLSAPERPQITSTLCDFPTIESASNARLGFLLFISRLLVTLFLRDPAS